MKLCRLSRKDEKAKLSLVIQLSSNKLLPITSLIWYYSFICSVFFFSVATTKSHKRQGRTTFIVGTLIGFLVYLYRNSLTEGTTRMHLLKCEEFVNDSRVFFRKVLSRKNHGERKKRQHRGNRLMMMMMHTFAF